MVSVFLNVFFFCCIALHKERKISTCNVKSMNPIESIDCGLDFRTV